MPNSQCRKSEVMYLRSPFDVSISNVDFLWECTSGHTRGNRTTPQVGQIYTSNGSVLGRLGEGGASYSPDP